MNRQGCGTQLLKAPLQSSTTRESVDAPSPAARTRRAIGRDHRMSQLACEAVCAAQQPSVGSDPTADTATNCDDDEIPEPLSNAEPIFCTRCRIRMATGRPVAFASPSLCTLYRASTDYAGYLLVAVSQSGQTPEIVELVDQARARGARAIAITNDPASPLAGSADLVVDLGAGQERAVPATKTVTSQLAAFAIIAQALGDLGLDDRSAAELPGEEDEVLADPAPAIALGQWLEGADRLVTVARGLLYGAAREAALKIEETTSRFTAAFSVADLRHGPIAIAANGPPVLAFAHSGPASADVADIVVELRSRGADARLLGPVKGSDVCWSAAAPEILAPILAVTRGQQLALVLTCLLGLDPDALPGLTKVTIT
ncbi:MAG: SIS domain-containing protein [Acidimicrobiales bacterium]|jgi:glucosamine--fructose-6-phosphate aminotransferase (isomerizing)